VPCLPAALFFHLLGFWWSKPGWIVVRYCCVRYS
jgi:hypothetical protein